MKKIITILVLIAGPFIFAQQKKVSASTKQSEVKKEATCDTTKKKDGKSCCASTGEANKKVKNKKDVNANKRKAEREKRVKK